MTTILITGSSGFVGSHALEILMKEPSVRLVAACRDRKKLLPNYNGEVRQGDLRDSGYLTGLFDGVDVVVHAASWSSLWGNAEKSQKLFLEPSLQVFDRFFSSTAQRIVNISTTSAASPDKSTDPTSVGIDRPFWPHLSNVIKIENQLRLRATNGKTVVNLRLGLFVGQRYGLGLLPILLPRLKTHLVPWVAGGQSKLPLIDGQDCGRAIGLACTTPNLEGYCSYNIVGRKSPTTRDIINFLHDEFDYPRPHFGVPFSLAYKFAWLMEKLDGIFPWEPLIVRSIVHLLEETGADNAAAAKDLDYVPQCDWRESVRRQVEEILDNKGPAMKMAVPDA